MAVRRGTIRVLTVDDHAVTRQGISLLLGHVDDISVVGAASDGRKAVQLARENRPDVVLMDAVMPGLNGLEATRQMKQAMPDCKVVILSGFVDEDQLLNALEAGVDGYIEKASGIDEVLRAIRSVSAGTKYFSRRLEEKFDLPNLINRAHAGDRKSGIEVLSSREREVLQLIGEASSNAQVAETLSISIKTVEAHLTRIKEKLSAKNRGEMIRIALRAGLVRDERGLVGSAESAGDQPAG
jgi:DNA-binding NarL/FixJ family response regulator